MLKVFENFNLFGRNLVKNILILSKSLVIVVNVGQLTITTIISAGSASFTTVWVKIVPVGDKLKATSGKVCF